MFSSTRRVVQTRQRPGFYEIRKLLGQIDAGNFFSNLFLRFPIPVEISKLMFNSLYSRTIFLRIVILF